MGSYTSGRGLYIPAYQEVNYDDELAVNFQQLADPLPKYNDISAAPDEDGFTVYITGDGATTPEGLYQRKSGSYERVTDPSNIDHDALQNFVANEHVDHSSVSVTGTGSLTGGGDLTSSRTLDVADSAIDTAELADAAVTIAKLAFNPATQSELDTHEGDADAHHTKTTSGEIDHDATANYVAGEHVDHTTVSVTGTGSLTGGGTIDANRTLDVADGGIDTAELAAEAVTEAILDAMDAPSDGEILSYNATEGRFEWVADESGTTGAPTDASYLTTAAESGLSNETVVDAYPFAPADLSFDPATQSELDTHAGDADVHHTKTTSAVDLTDVSADSVADAHHTAFTPTDHDGRDHASALTSTFSPSNGDIVIYSGGSWGTEQKQQYTVAEKTTAETYSTTGSYFTIGFDSVPISHIGGMDTSTNSFSPPVDGEYEISVHFVYDSASSANSYAKIENTNTGDYIAWSGTGNGSDPIDTHTMQTTTALTTTDVLEVQMTTDTAGDIYGPNIFQFKAEYLGPS